MQNINYPETDSIVCNIVSASMLATLEDETAHSNSHQTAGVETRFKGMLLSIIS